MKKIGFVMLALFVAAMTLASCSNVDESERFIYVQPADVARGVLVEDFTGQRCVNCPNANDVIHDLQTQYGDSNIIAVGIHSGPLGFKGNDRVKGLATDLGDSYYRQFGAEYQPVGMVNRHGLANYTDWAALAHTELQLAPSMELKVECHYDAASRLASIDVSALALNKAVNGRLQVWVVEDSITALQMMPDGSYNYGYVHNHVFRAAVNGDWGTEVSILATQTMHFSFSYTLPDDFVDTNCSFVVFVYDDNGVLQARKIKVKKG